MWLVKLREMKDASNLTTREIALQSGVPEPTLEKLFAGVTRDPKLETMRQLVHFFGYTLDDLEDRPIKKSPSAAEATPRDLYELSPQMTALYAAMNQLNDQGQEKVLEYADDLVSSGKYIKSDPAGLDQRKA